MTTSRIAAAVLVALVAITSVRVASVMASGRPFYLDCGGLGAEDCEQVYERQVPRSQGRFPDWFIVIFDPVRPGSTCGAITAIGWPFFGPPSYMAMPLCP
jgi:hypothetical protein